MTPMAIKEINIFKNVLCFLIFIFSHQLNANDGAFYMQGNHLIPITENQVSISKEILTITQRGGVFYIDVDYTFYNPGNEKEVLMGFEAPLPYGAAYSKTFSREHPFLNDFTVKFNGASLEYKSDLVDIDAFKNESNLKTLSNHEFNNFKERVRNYGYDYSNLGSYIYVNYFTVNFKPGKNKIRHTYSFKQSGRIDFPLQFQYILKLNIF